MLDALNPMKWPLWARRVCALTPPLWVVLFVAWMIFYVVDGMMAKWRG